MLACWKGKTRLLEQKGTDTHIFKWLEIAQLKDETFYPLFLKKEISNLPDGFTIRTEVR